jgi:hypothetical protein
MSKKQIKSIQQKMDRIKSNYPEIDFDKVAIKHNVIKRYFDLQQQKFFLEFDMQKCSQLLPKYKKK